MKIVEKISAKCKDFTKISFFVCAMGKIRIMIYMGNNRGFGGRAPGARKISIILAQKLNCKI